MELIINKIGKIKDAKIKINGLTVIAGKNDTGKSTVGKVLYAFGRALALYNVFFDDVEKSKLVVNNIVPLFKKYIATLGTSFPLVQEIAPLLEEEGNPPFNAFKVNNLRFSEIKDILVKMQNSCYSSTEITTLITETLEEIGKIQEASAETKMAKTLATTLRLTFAGDILNSKHHEAASVAIREGDREVLSSDFSTTKEFLFNMDEILSKSIFKDVLYIETPFVLENIGSTIKPHWYELKQKIGVFSSGRWNKPSVNEELLKFIQEQIFGNALIVFDDKNNSFRYQVDKDSNSLDMVNVACGTKSFSLIFLLLKLNLLTKSVLLVLDEPENHLHPEWQIKYAEMVSLLVSKGFSVVLTSHSPTFIHALAAYGRKYNVTEKTSFYLAEKLEDTNYSTLTDVTDNIERISENLVEPLDKLFLGI